MKTRIALFALALTILAGISAATLADDAAPAPAKETGTISGRVLGTEGPVAGATVRAVLPKRLAGKKGPNPASATDGTSTTDTKRDIVATATTTSDGTYTLKDVPVGSVRIVATLKRVGAGTIKKPVQVLAGQDTKVEDITLQPRTKAAGSKTSKNNA